MARLEGTSIHRFVAAENLEDAFDARLIDARDQFGQTALHLAVRYGTVNRCLATTIKWDLDVSDSDGNTPLHTACALNRPREVSLLLAAGASPHVTNRDNKRPLAVTRTRKMCANSEAARANRDEIRSLLYETETCVKSSLNTRRACRPSD